jgi:putative ABC transport system permease protein
MRRLRCFWKRLGGVFTGARREAELADEIEMHLQMQTDDNLKLGMPPEEARRAAVLKFGGVEAVKEGYRDQRGWPLLAAFAQDVRFALRTMRKERGFTLAAVLSLALGIGVTTAIFSVADSVLLRPLPYRHPERLARVMLNAESMTGPAFDLLRRESRSIESAALFVDKSFDLAGWGEPERLPGARVSAGLFRVLGVAPQLGRAFTGEEDRRDDVVLIGDNLWKRRFGGDRSVLGRKVLLNGEPHTIIGVMPPGFQFPDGPELPFWAGTYPPAEVWRPMALDPDERTCENCYNFAMLVRLRPGTGVAAAREEMNALIARSRLGMGNRRAALTVRTLHDAVTGKVRTPILILAGAVALALLLACVNTANLLLVRGLRRQGELALRRSLGATGGRIVGQLLAESLTLALCAAVLALPIAWVGTSALLALAPEGVPRTGTVGIDLRTLLFAFGIALASALVSGAVPAVLTALRAPGELIKAGGRGGSGGFSGFRSFLVVAECALSVVLLVGSGLLAKSFLKVARTPLGFHTGNVLSMRTSLPDTRFQKDRRAALIGQLVDRCRTIPGVKEAAAVSVLPLTVSGEGWPIAAEDRGETNESITARVREVSPSYFRTLGIRLQSGREFTERDGRDGDAVAIVSERAARLLWPGVADPLGRRIRHRPVLTVVGVVDDTRASGLDRDILPYLYLPFRQVSPEQFALVVRSRSRPMALAAAVKNEIRRIDMDQPVTHVAVLDQLVSDSIAPRRLPAVVMTAFGIFALVLAAIGIYGVLSYSVALRTHEIGVRMALGASRAGVLCGILRSAGSLAAMGAGIGLLAAFQLTPLLRSLLYGVAPAETAVFLGCALLLVGVALVAGFVPARRAAKLDPMVCLRYE